jgi:hypothetical protein
MVIRRGEEWIEDIVKAVQDLVGNSHILYFEEVVYPISLLINSVNGCSCRW